MRHDQARQTVLIGAGSIACLADELRKLNARTVALFTSPHAGRSPGYRLVRSTIRSMGDVEVTNEFGAVRPHAPIADSECAAAQLADGPGGVPDALIAYGGGSVSDTAKAVSILLAEGSPLEAHCSTFTPPATLHHVQLDAPKTPVITIPVTLSGAEVTPGGGATDANGIKRVFWDDKVASRVLAFDPIAITDVPASTILTTAMNGLAHCAEALYSRTATPITDALALAGARHFGAAMPVYAAAGPDAATPVLEELLLAAYLGGSVISNARVGLHHAICHVLGAGFGVPHGVANTIMLPYALEYNADQTRDKQAQFAGALAEGLGVPAAIGAPRLVRVLQDRCGLPTTLAQAGITEESLDGVAAMVMQDRGLFFNPKTVSDQREVRGVLVRALNGVLEGAE